MPEIRNDEIDPDEDEKCCHGYSFKQIRKYENNCYHRWCVECDRLRDEVCNSCSLGDCCCTCSHCSNCGCFLSDDNTDECNDCARENISLHEYNSNVVDVLDVFVPMGLRNYGIELEFELNDGYCLETFVNKIHNHPELSKLFICKEDGSLDEQRGVEVVSIPMVYSKLHKVLSDFYQIMNIRNKTDPSSSCGTHIHISREATSSRTIARYWALWKRGEGNAQMRELLEAIAGRKSNYYARWNCDSPVYMRPSNRTFAGRKYFSRHSYMSSGDVVISDHYAAVSSSGRHPTFETRMWAGATRERTALKYLEALDLLLSICEETHGIRVLTDASQLLMEIGKRLNAYPALKECFTDRYPGGNARTRLAVYYPMIAHLVEQHSITDNKGQEKINAVALEKRAKRKARKEQNGRDVKTVDLYLPGTRKLKVKKANLRVGLQILERAQQESLGIEGFY